jgi:hypothetical protein
MKPSEKWIIETVLQKLQNGVNLSRTARSTVDQVEECRISVEANNNFKEAMDGLRSLLTP